MNKKRQNLVENYLNLRAVDNWLCDVLTSGKLRFRKVPEELKLGTEKLYAFPIKKTKKIVLVGAEELSKKDKRIWHLMTNAEAFYKADLILQPADAFVFGGQTPVPYDLPRSLTRILTRIIQYIPCEGAWLATSSEGSLKVEADWNSPELLGREFSLEGDSLFTKIKKIANPILLERDHPDWEKMTQDVAPVDAEVWGVLPLMVGQRLIGALALWREEVFGEDEWLKLQQISIYAAASVDIFATFSQMADHLRRQAMLNDFALIVSSAQNLGQIVRRVFALLERTFRTELLSLFLLSSDGRTLREYRNLERRFMPRTDFLEGHPIEKIVSEGRSIRIADAKLDSYFLGTNKAQSALLVPLKYRGEVIGVLSLENEEIAAFSVDDENLLVVIASHLAGLVEYGRLREEAEARARNLGLIHEVIQQVIGLTNVREVAQITADLLVRHFSYELAVVLLVDRNQSLNIEGISGVAASLVRSAFDEFEYPNKDGISGHVFATGESIMVDDVTKNPLYTHIPGWDVGAEICVALKDGDKILGIIDIESSEKNAFTHSDLLALEALAGFLTSAVSSVDRYQMLQDTIQILQTTQEELHERMEAQRTAENRLIQAAKLAAVGEMAAGVAHELNNPLTTVAGFSELLIDDLPAESPQREDLEMVLREAKRARNVVRRLLDFARQSESVRVRADLNEVIDDVAALTNHLFENSNIDFEIKLGEKLPWVVIDRDQIKQVVLNLLHNALHAMPQGGALSLSTRTRKRDKKKWLVMSVQDDGKGISANDLARIFEPFFTTKADDGGTGLGLAVSYGIITDHDGFIEVDSAPDEGASFTVWLPIEENKE
ncbi:MAG: GAF domain-containing protein [Anaerolineae bacterium]|nr:GAF domain-containing protein [Anaerolineae bacterium]